MDSYYIKINTTPPIIKAITGYFKRFWYLLEVLFVFYYFVILDSLKTPVLWFIFRLILGTIILHIILVIFLLRHPLLIWLFDSELDELKNDIKRDNYITY